MPHSIGPIARIELREIHIPLREPFAASHGTISEKRVILVRVCDADGATGWGECVALEDPGYVPETVDTAWPALADGIAPGTVGRSFSRLDELASHIDGLLEGHRMAKASLEMACWDLASRRAEAPLARVLGGVRESVAAGVAIGLQKDNGQLVEKAGQALDDGYQRIKIKVAPGRDVEALHALRAAYGADLPLSVDANASYQLDGMEALKAFDEFGLLMIEQPLGRDAFVEHARLQRSISTPICLDESICTMDDLETTIRLGSAKIVNLKPGRIGGLSASLAMHARCVAAGLPIWCGGMLETGVGRAANVALASLEGFTLPGDLSPSARYWEEDIVAPEWTMDASGMVKVPWDRPGLGVEVDVARVEALTARFQQFEAGSG